MDYIKDGKYINFGLSRGLGSIAYASGAVVVSQLIDLFNPTIIAFIHIGAGILVLLTLFSMPDYQIKNEVQEKQQSSIFDIIVKYKTFFFILLAFTFMFSASTALSTYLINIVRNLGGSTSLYGIAIFCMSITEMPVMSVTSRLLKKYKAETLILLSALFYII